MKRCISLILSIVLIFSFFTFNTSAYNDEVLTPYIVNYSLTAESDIVINNENVTRASGLIQSYSLYLTKTGSTLHITGLTSGSMEVVKSGFKDLMIQRRKNSSYAWEDYYEYGNLYIDAWMANLDTTLAVAPNYQYRITCKHYAKKNILMVQTISNVSNIVTTV